MRLTPESLKVESYPTTDLPEKVAKQLGASQEKLEGADEAARERLGIPRR